MRTGPRGLVRGAARALAGHGRRSDRVELTERLRARERQQAVVSALGQSALASRDTRAVLDEAVRAVATTLDLCIVNLVERRPDGSQVFAATYGWDRRPGDPAPAAGGPATQVIRGGEPLLVRSTEALPAPARATMDALGIRSSAAVVVAGDDGPWGALVSHSSSPDAFGPDDLHFLQSVANVVAAVVARARVEHELQLRATHDALTGLPGRELLRERLNAALAAQAGPVGLLLLDLNGFKDVNDSLGHHVGDDVLRQVAPRLRTPLDPRDTVARLGGDEFAVCLAAPRSREELRDLTGRVSDVLHGTYETPFGPVSLGGSVGAALAPDHGLDAHTLLRHADQAMYRAKRESTGWAVYDPRLDEDPTTRLRAVNELRAAIAQGQIRLAYQPVVHLATGTVRSVEALARWTSPTRGPQSPADFVALAERSGLIGDLTDEILRLACEQAARWLTAGRGLAVAVNLPGSVLAQHGYARRLAQRLEQAGVPTRLLHVEVTETTLVSEAAVTTLRHLVDLGMRVLVDDFGTGYSSLGRLKQLPVQTLKIDRSFITGLAEDRADLAIVRAVVALADELGLDVVAEGVETRQVADALVALGVPRAQGYLYAPPLPAAELEARLDAWPSSRTAMTEIG
ncbi:putative bifunctional diguanylate cyclase/phosphodiesterase [Motilibacter aurantiacus]|uniref:putative bifunctional diguanylate cyclase/phosphodiesterase n=1 Tax=Motilibacter aurantiacus TaxID=2714955 RepID=UPI0014072C74|nr:EAL domain-containing protein [Motilibacter aurantiacus]NHC46533.1 EAL domain-containing protein [Motilibacter aurantiacus]